MADAKRSLVTGTAGKDRPVKRNFVHVDDLAEAILRALPDRVRRL